jgi:GNAT superfamily N-acetyltransferase
MDVQEYRLGPLLISTDPALLDLEAIFAFLSERSYWARERPREVVARSLQHSFCFGLYDEAGETRRQVGLARVITDFATYAYLSDVYVLEEYRGRGVGKWLLRSILDHPELQGLRKWHLGTRDAHDFYRQLGFRPLRNPANQMELRPLEAALRQPAGDDGARIG